ncbi:TetR/AcrR family transcriptional regulator [Arthrobacter globiformis]|uniref:TetR/AcrR family transcriptional regulator n=1 Tax=Arthrobacter globiformis TaxID=1665 RepID=UPI002791D49B|nr:TetR family transcriptional regulator [Arthrobacter globiformis]MDQ0616347.1 AcrR family transcriptional regulator [Arthrobacter globiformis]
MAWDTEATRERLLDAAIREFSERGFSGARINQISKTSGTNRERIYFYFGGKAQLFEAALTRQLAASLEELPVLGSGPEAVADFAGRYFDVSDNQPALARLTFWEGLERGTPVDAERRALRAADKVNELRRALPGVGRRDAEELLLTIVTLCHAWASSPNVSAVIAGTQDRARRRASIARTAELLARDVTDAAARPIDFVGD